MSEKLKIMQYRLDDVEVAKEHPESLLAFVSDNDDQNCIGCPCRDLLNDQQLHSYSTKMSK